MVDLYVYLADVKFSGNRKNVTIFSFCDTLITLQLLHLLGIGQESTSCEKLQNIAPGTLAKGSVCLLIALLLIHANVIVKRHKAIFHIFQLNYGCLFLFVCVSMSVIN